MPKIRAATVAEHRAQTEVAVIDAFEVLLAEKGFDAVTLGDVAARVGVSRATVYNYVEDKSGLLMAAAERAGHRLVAAVDASVSDAGVSVEARLRSVVAAVIISLAKDSRSLGLLQIRADGFRELDRTRATAPFVEVKGRLEAIVAEGVDSAVFTPLDDLEFTTELILGVIQAAIQQLVDEPRVGGHIVDAACSFVARALSVR